MNWVFRGNRVSMTNLSKLKFQEKVNLKIYYKGKNYFYRIVVMFDASPSDKDIY